jgi:hypothetical protein
MNAEVENGGVIIECVLSAITVMHVPVKNGYLLYLMLVLQMPRRYRDVVEEAETHGLGMFCVVTRRTDSTERISETACDNGINSLLGRSYR